MRLHPGLTLRDIRFAILAEQLFVGTPPKLDFVYRNVQPTTETFIQEIHIQEQPDTIDKLLAKMNAVESANPLDRPCPTCGGSGYVKKSRRKRRSKKRHNDGPAEATALGTADDYTMEFKAEREAREQRNARRQEALRKAHGWSKARPAVVVPPMLAPVMTEADVNEQIRTIIAKGTPGPEGEDPAVEPFDWARP